MENDLRLRLVTIAKNCRIFAAFGKKNLSFELVLRCVDCELASSDIT